MVLKRFIRNLTLGTLTLLASPGESQDESKIDSTIRVGFYQATRTRLTGEGYEDLSKYPELVAVYLGEAQLGGMYLNMGIDITDEDRVELLGGREDNPSYFSHRGMVRLRTNADEETQKHEFKHARTADIVKHHPEFKKRWEQIAIDEAGNSLYLTQEEQECYQRTSCRETNKHLDEKLNELENRKLGFVRNYGRLNFWEDTATFAEYAETYSKLDEELPRNVRFKKKLALCLEYNLIQPDARDYMRLLDFDREFAHVTNDFYPRDYVSEFDTMSSGFLQNHPNSIFTANVHILRGRMYNLLGQRAFDDDERKTYFTAAIGEYEYALRAPNRNEDTITEALYFAEQTADFGCLHKPELAAAYKVLYNQVEERFNAGDITVVTQILSLPLD